MQRLVSNRTITGDDVLTRKEAWLVIGQLRADDRVARADEPAHLEPSLRVISTRDDRSHRLWTDDYCCPMIL